MNKLIYYLAIFQLINFSAFSQEIEMSGTIINADNKATIEFVNIGILNKNKGTVSNKNGKFSLKLSKDFSGDSLTISHISYETVKITVENSKNLVIRLQPKANELEEVFVINKKKKSRKFGIKSYNPLLWLGTISEEKDILENAQRINIPDETTVRVKYVNLYLRTGFESDSCYVRLNFYKNSNDAPGDRIIFENITRNKKIEPGWLQIDLTKNDIYIQEDFFIGVEFMPDFIKPRELYLGAILTKGKGYSRKNSQGEWKKLEGASTLNVEVEY